LRCRGKATLNIGWPICRLMAFPNGSILGPRCKEGNEKYPYNFASQRIKE
jgi:hypothetical protein